MTATAETAETDVDITTSPESPDQREGHAKPLPGRPVPLCTHIMATGVSCGSPAVKGTGLCFHHSAVKTALGRVKPLDQVPYGIFSPIPFVFAEDAASLHINFHLLLQAVAEKRVDQPTGTLLHRILRSLAANLKNPLIAEAPCTHGEGDKINGQSEAHNDAPAPKKVEQAAEETDPLKGTGFSPSDEPFINSGALASEGSPARSATCEAPEAANPKSDEEAIAALPPAVQNNIATILARRGHLTDGERQYFSLPPYDKEKPEPLRIDPLHPEVQRVIALSCERP